MKKSIVITTINSPTEATVKFCQKKGWDVFIVGDLKTPHPEYRLLESKFSNVLYLDVEDQKKLYPQIGEVIGWNTIQRRNIGIIHAYNEGTEIFATVDDDNIPYDNWGRNLLVDKTVEVDLYESENGVFDPLSVTQSGNYLWHRGYPIDLLRTRHLVNYKGKTQRKVLVQADLWDGDPDIDAITRLIHRPIVKYQIESPYCSSNISPFNSQNTFLSRKVIPYYSVLPFIGRMDDIWGGYILQHYFPDSVVYCPSSVYQDRNEQDLVKNLENEILGYRKTYEFLNDLPNFINYLPEKSRSFWNLYRKQFSEK